MTRARNAKPFLCGYCKGRFYSLASTTDHIRVQHPRRASVDVFERVASVENDQTPDFDKSSTAEIAIWHAQRRRNGETLDEVEKIYADMADGR